MITLGSMLIILHAGIDKCGTGTWGRRTKPKPPTSNGEMDVSAWPHEERKQGMHGMCSNSYLSSLRWHWMEQQSVNQSNIWWVPNRERRMARLEVRFWLVSAASLARGSHSTKNLPRIFHKCTIVLLHTKRVPKNHTIHVSPKSKQRFVFHQLSKSVITLKITSPRAVSLCALCTVVYIIAGRCPCKRWRVSQACQESPARD